MSKHNRRPFVFGRPRAILYIIYLYLSVGLVGMVASVASFFYGLHTTTTGIVLLFVGVPLNIFVIVKLFRFVGSINRVIQRDHHLPCPVCLYPLFDLSTQSSDAKCPECETEVLRSKTIVAWMKMPDAKKKILRHHYNN